MPEKWSQYIGFNSTRVSIRNKNKLTDWVLVLWMKFCYVLYDAYPSVVHNVLMTAKRQSFFIVHFSKNTLFLQHKFFVIFVPNAIYLQRISFTDNTQQYSNVLPFIRSTILNLSHVFVDSPLRKRFQNQKFNNCTILEFLFFFYIYISVSPFVSNATASEV